MTRLKRRALSCDATSALMADGEAGPPMRFRRPTESATPVAGGESEIEALIRSAHQLGVLGQCVAVTRRDRGETQEQFGRRVGLSRHQVYRIESDRNDLELEPILALASITPRLLDTLSARVRMMTDEAETITAAVFDQSRVLRDTHGAGPFLGREPDPLRTLPESVRGIEVGAAVPDPGKLTLDFRNVPEILGKIKALADAEDRTPELQARHLLRRAFMGSDPGTTQCPNWAREEASYG